MRANATLACVLALCLCAAGCGGEDADPAPDPATERSDRPAKPPPGWRTVVNRRAGFTVSVPRSWRVRGRRGATLVRSSDRLVAVTIAADRSAAGRDTRTGAYARRAFKALPGFRRLRARPARPLRASPYESARVVGSGRLGRRGQPQRIVIAAFRRPGRVTYSAVAFIAVVAGRAPHAGTLTTLLESLRGRRPQRARPSRASGRAAPGRRRRSS